ncbi:hypothetical protein Lalb_Chr17g0342601 [Lupinus albus]|uniref:Uncharacterized protein n=2 Tax=Lupinus albus TaxID=3870 RepID=A0A6A4P2L5_LUPAL|nr:hypothetical protein Lalb_Chr17g0342601 [Lupinus albus]
MLSTSQGLLEMERASPRAQIKFIYPNFIIIKDVIPIWLRDYSDDPSSKPSFLVRIKSFICDFCSMFYMPPI